MLSLLKRYMVGFLAVTMAAGSLCMDAAAASEPSLGSHLSWSSGSESDQIGGVSPHASNGRLGLASMYPDDSSTKIGITHGYGVQLDLGDVTGAVSGTINGSSFYKVGKSSAYTAVCGPRSIAYDGLEDVFALPYEFVEFMPVVPEGSAGFSDPTVSLSGAVSGESVYTLTGSASASNVRVYFKTDANYRKISGDFRDKNLSIESNDSDACTYWDAFRSAKLALTDSASRPADSSYSIDLTSAFLPDSAKKTSSVVVEMESMTGPEVERSLDLGVVSSGNRTHDLGIEAAGKYAHVEWTTYSGKTGWKYVKIPDGAQISYDAQGGSGAPAASQKVFAGNNVTVASGTPTREGYDFLGWYSAPDGKGTKYTAGQSVRLDGNLTLYAAWKARHKVTTSITNGTITDTVTGLAPGSDCDIIYTPDDGYYVKSVTVDGTVVSGSDLDAVRSSYSFTNIQGDHTISVECAKIPELTCRLELTGSWPESFGSALGFVRVSGSDHLGNHQTFVRGLSISSEGDTCSFSVPAGTYTAELLLPDGVSCTGKQFVPGSSAALNAVEPRDNEVSNTTIPLDLTNVDSGMIRYLVSASDYEGYTHRDTFFNQLK